MYFVIQQQQVQTGFVNSEFVVWCHELVQDAAENAEGDENKEECEEAWEYLEFLKAEIK